MFGIGYGDIGLMGRLVIGDEDDLIQAKNGSRLLSGDEMPDMNGVESSSHNSDFHFIIIIS
jgi:hypothetical protein